VPKLAELQWKPAAAPTGVVAPESG
jgi:hypothetical protein